MERSLYSIRLTSLLSADSAIGSYNFEWLLLFPDGMFDRKWLFTNMIDEFEFYSSFGETIVFNLKYYRVPSDDGISLGGLDLNRLINALVRMGVDVYFG